MRFYKITAIRSRISIESGEFKLKIVGLLFTDDVIMIEYKIRSYYPLQISYQS